jgi:YihY family inner membrane protein
LTLAQLWARIASLARYLAQTEVHTYAFSVAANAILSLFPFIVMMYTVARTVFHSQSMEVVIGNMVRYFLPTGQDFVVKNMSLVANARSGVRVAAVVMLLVSSSGIFLPLEVALNQVWGVTKNRSYLMNQLVSTGLALIVCALALGSVAITTFQRALLTWIFLGHADNAVFRFVAQWLLQVTAGFLSVMLFFFTYWILPNRSLPWRAVLPSALVTGLLWELAKYVYMAALPLLDFRGVYGPFATSVGLMLWAFLTGLLLLAGAHYSATGYTLKLVHQADVEKDRAAQAAAGPERESRGIDSGA